MKANGAMRAVWLVWKSCQGLTDRKGTHGHSKKVAIHKPERTLPENSDPPPSDLDSWLPVRENTGEAEASQSEVSCYSILRRLKQQEKKPSRQTPGGQQGLVKLASDSCCPKTKTTQTYLGKNSIGTVLGVEPVYCQGNRVCASSGCNGPTGAACPSWESGFKS